MKSLNSIIAFNFLITLCVSCNISDANFEISLANEKENYKLDITGPSSFLAGSCSSAFTVTLNDLTDTPTTSESNISFALSGAGAGSFYSDSSCTSSISSISLPALSSSVTLYYKSASYDAANLTLSTTATGVDDGSYSFSTTDQALFELDADFASAGTYSNTRANLDYLNGLEFDRDDKLVLASIVYSGGNTYSYLSRIDPDLGAIDTTFNTTGDRQISYGGSQTYIGTPFNDTDGKITTIGPAENGSAQWRFFMSRTNNDGTMDTSFGTGGYVDASYCGTWCWGWDHIKIGSYYYISAYDSASQEDTVFFRIDDSGAYDSTYGTTRHDPSAGTYLLQNGYTMLNDSTHIYALYLTNDAETTSTTNYYICKYLIADGSLEASFGTSGCAFVDGQNTSRHGVGTTSKTMILSSDENSIYLVMRYEDDNAIAKINTSDGSLDSSFGSSGIVKLSDYEEFIEVEEHSSLGLILLGQITNGSYTTYTLKVIDKDTGAASSNTRISDTFMGEVDFNYHFSPFNIEVKDNYIYVSGVLYTPTQQEIIQRLKIFY